MCGQRRAAYRAAGELLGHLSDRFGAGVWLADSGGGVLAFRWSLRLGVYRFEFSEAVTVAELAAAADRCTRLDVPCLASRIAGCWERSRALAVDRLKKAVAQDGGDKGGGRGDD